MNGWLLDTNVISELRRQRTEPRVLAFVVAQKLDWLHVSDVTFAEIRFGIEQVIDPAQRAELADWRNFRAQVEPRNYETVEHRMPYNIP